MRVKPVFKGALIILVLLLSAECFAQDEESSQPRVHDGYMARFMLGAGYQKFTCEDYLSGKDMVFTGFSGDIVLQLGNTVWSNLILFGEISACFMPDAGVKLGGGSYATDKAWVNTIGIGAGATYYFMPVNIYASASMGIVKSTMEIDNNTSSGKYGLGLSMSFGKEWWASDNWGVGVAIVGRFTTMKRKSNDNEMSGLYGGLSVTATYN
ncbi:MAG: hypothetical protein CVV44_11155 [Spirochaetae bacterium HGW-Spirochaetae-1]|jgi:hypothetical protein|nr:MAG: hypothetical protein CVV44_11155 [Spirochaetae bacterium HGW-Spirochaetae-1]